MFGHVSLVLFLLTKTSCLNIDTIDHDGSTSLVYAISSNSVDTVNILLDNGASVNPLSTSHHIPLCLVSKYGNLPIANLLLNRGAKLDVCDSDGLYPLHIASRQGHDELAQLLISHSANVEITDEFHKWTPLFYGASEGHLNCIQVLISANAKVDVRDNYGWLPWTYALYRGHIAVADLLVVDCAPDVHVVKQIAIPSPIGPMSLFDVPQKLTEADLDDIPTLSLPPPIMPFRI